MTPIIDQDQQRDVCVAVLHQFQNEAAAHGAMRRAVGRFTDSSGPNGNSAGVGSSENTAPAQGTGRTSAARGDRATRWTQAPGMAPSRTMWRKPMSVGVALKRTIQAKGWDTETAMGTVMAKWPAIVGSTVAAHCHVEHCEGHRLIVACSSTAWAKQLTLLLPHIERRIAEEVGAGVVDQVIVRGPSAPSWKHGPLSVPGRGPRDTYG